MAGAGGRALTGTSVPEESTVPRSDRRSRSVLVASALVVGGVAGAYLTIPGVGDFVDEMLRVLTSDDPDRARRWVEPFGWRGPLLIVGLMTAQMFLIVIPSWLLMVLAVLVYGEGLGSLISLVAVVTASSVGYGVGAAIGRHSVRRLLGPGTERRVRDEACRYGVWAVVIARLSPLFSNDAISFVGGLLRMGYARFLAATVAGIVPLIGLIATFGRNAETMRTGLLWISVVSLLGLAAKIVRDHRRGDAGPCQGRG